MDTDKFLEDVEKQALEYTAKELERPLSDVTKIVKAFREHEEKPLFGDATAEVLEEAPDETPGEPEPDTPEVDAFGDPLTGDFKEEVADGSA
jgi:hypothetical protein